MTDGAPRRTVLIVEDEADSRVALATVLRTAGHRVLAAQSGEEALGYLESVGCPDLILLDIWLGDISAAVFLRRKAAGAGRAIPVILVSADHAALARPWHDDSALRGKIRKPVDPEELLSMVTAALRMGRADGITPVDPPRPSSPESDLARGGVLATIAHDLRTPLSTITLAATKMLRHADEGAGGLERRQDAETILRNARRIERMVRDLLDYMHLETGDLLLSRRIRRLADLVHQAVRSFDYLVDEIQLDLVVQTDAREVEVECDRERILQILNTLLSLAVELTEPGQRVRITVSCSLEEMVVAIRDGGGGIPSEDLSTLFTARAIDSGSPRPRWRRSIGLGLAIAARLARAHGGRIWVEREADGGTPVSFALPLLALDRPTERPASGASIPAVEGGEDPKREPDATRMPLIDGEELERQLDSALRTLR